jgi:hypothetical protein
MAEKSTQKAEEESDKAADGKNRRGKKENGRYRRRCRSGKPQKPTHY